MRIFLLSIIVLCAFSATAAGAKEYESDIINTSAGDLKITFIGHGTLMFSFGGKVIHIDPFGQAGDYNKLPRADIILITHEHSD
ncbi:MAG: MBL fold metallo-hydrolase, partial [Deltaproteobacteria bacterium]|nr:MBL fold metallo-hydrolase [Deltaproteobacteria bacterium]